MSGGSRDFTSKEPIISDPAYICNPFGQIGVAHTFNPSTGEAEADGSLCLRPAWSMKQVPRQLGLHGETKDKTTVTIVKVTPVLFNLFSTPVHK